MNIIGIKRDIHVTPMVDANHVFSADEHILVAGSQKDVLKLMAK